MRRYRYRTCVLVGSWREARDAAVADAIRSRQARPGAGVGGLIWLVPGRIEDSPEEGEEPPG
jgi:hypothetical protein